MTLPVGLAPEAGGCARPGHRLAPVVTTLVRAGPDGERVTACASTWPGRGAGPPASHVSATRAQAAASRSGWRPRLAAAPVRTTGLTPVVTSLAAVMFREERRMKWLAGPVYRTGVRRAITNQLLISTNLVFGTQVSICQASRSKV